jgi:hypothetical protein
MPTVDKWSTIFWFEILSMLASTHYYERLLKKWTLYWNLGLFDRLHDAQYNEALPLSMKKWGELIVPL